MLVSSLPARPIKSLSSSVNAGNAGTQHYPVLHGFLEVIYCIPVRHFPLAVAKLVSGLSRKGQVYHSPRLDKRALANTPYARLEGKTAFATPLGLFQFTTMPFGLHRATARFQHLLDHMLCHHCQFAVASMIPQ